MNTYTCIRHLNDIFQFGKYNKCTLGEVMMYNPNYLEWVIDNISGLDCEITDSAIEEIRLIFNNFFITEKIHSCLYKMEMERYRAELESDNDEMYDANYYYNSYGKYFGSYAQDEAGYSDDDIDTIFDGDPSAYWNID